MSTADLAKRAELDQRAPIVGRVNPIPTGSLTVEKLSRNQRNYINWSKMVDHFLAACSGLNLYLDGTIPKPRDDQPVALMNWTINNSAVVGALHQWIDAEESSYLSDRSKELGHKLTAKEAWDALRGRHKDQGVIDQIMLFEELYTIHYERSTPYTETTRRILNIVEKIYSQGMPTQDQLAVIFMTLGTRLNLPEVCSFAANRFAESTSDKPFTPAMLADRLAIQRQLDTSTSTNSSTVLTTRKLTERPKDAKRWCGIHMSTTHDERYCVGKGGGCEGMSIASADAKRRADERDKKTEGDKTKTNTQPKPQAKKATANVFKTKDGKAYIVDDESGQAYLLDSANANTTESGATISNTSSDSASIAFNFDGLRAAVAHITDKTPTDEILSAVEFQAHATTSPSPQCDVPWFLDTAASVHISEFINDFNDIKPVVNRRVKGLGSSPIAAAGIGDVGLTLSNGHSLSLKNTLYIPNCNLRLISCGALIKSLHCYVVFDVDKAYIVSKPSNQTLATGTAVATNLYKLDLHTDCALTVSLPTRTPTLRTWHARLGHANYQTVIDMAQHKPCEGMRIDLSQIPPICQSCILGKQVRSPVPKIREGEKSTRRLQKVFIDLAGKQACTSVTGNLYIMSIIDDYSAYPWAIPLKNKSQAFQALTVWKQVVEKEIGERVQLIQVDHGELDSAETQQWCDMNGIQLRFTAAHTSAFNGRVERLHLTIANKGRTMRIESKLPANLWDEFWVTASYLHARTSTRLLNHKTPFELFYLKKPDISHLREIGCKAFALILNKHNPKIFERSLECLLIGYSLNSKAYKCYHQPTRRIIETYHVKFVESHETETVPSKLTVIPENTSDAPAETHPQPVPPLVDPEPVTPNTRPHRTSKPTEKQAANLGLPFTSQLERMKAKMSTTCEEKRTEDTAFNVELGDLDDEPTVEEALKGPEAEKWDQGIREELQGLKEMNVYELVPKEEVPRGRKVLGCKIVLRRKRNENGETVRWKGRACVKGYGQVYGQDYTATTSPTACIESWRLLGHIAGVRDWPMHQVDIKTAYLYGLLPEGEEVYMEQPKRYEEEGKERWVWRLKKGLYGMKQSGRLWNRTMHDAMVSWEFKRLMSEHCIYHREIDGSVVIAAIHVDDFLITGSDLDTLSHFKCQLQEKWKISDLGEAKFCVGIKIERDYNLRTVSLSQTALIDRIVTLFGQNEAYPHATPMEEGLTLQRPPVSNQATTEEENLPYRSLIGMLMYVAVGTRPDISYAVSKLSGYLDCHRSSHWKAAIRVVRYLKGTRDLQLTLGGQTPILLSGYSDSDYGNCLDSRKSVSGYCFSLGSGVISYASRKQKTVATSSTEAEYIAASEACRELCWLRQVLTELNFDQRNATPLLCDNNGAISLSSDPTFHARAKHIDIRHHFIREKVENGSTAVTRVPTRENVADIFTKPLGKTLFLHIRPRLGLK